MANFTELTEDSDRDGLKDWFEYQVQDLSLEKDDDPDGDGHTIPGNMIMAFPFRGIREGREVPEFRKCGCFSDTGKWRRWM